MTWHLNRPDSGVFCGAVGAGDRTNPEFLNGWQPPAVICEDCTAAMNGAPRKSRMKHTLEKMGGKNRGTSKKQSRKSA